MRIEQDVKLDFKDVLIRPKRSTLTSRNDVTLARKFKSLHTDADITGVPVIAANMDGVGTLEMARVLGKMDMYTALTKHIPLAELVTAFNEDECIRRQAFYTSGISENDMQKLDQFMAQMSDQSIKICVDVANGYTESFVATVQSIREKYPDVFIMAGNVVTGEMVEELLLSGADMVKIGIGPGSVCTTRKMTGVGYPQLSAVIECADAAHGLKGMVCADGGCQVAGDVAKAFGAGADFAMLGGMFAGHDQGGGEIVTKDGQKVIQFYGMSSDDAMKKHAGGVATYRASEGKTVSVPYRGDVAETAREILGGLRSACTYVGAGYLKEMTKRTTFIRVTQQLNPMFGN